MEFEWDYNKDRAVLAIRGFDFDYAKRVFDDLQRFVKPDTRIDYGEDRFLAYGMIEGRVYVVVYTMRGSIYRIISARKAKPREVREYDDNQNQG
ncbi:MAG: BrnT family toxin [Rhodobacteraceae bacterium]|nr:BrnT family toxin [Paracoccaceae bacterium]